MDTGSGSGPCVQFLDPVPDMLNSAGNDVTTSKETLATKGTPVTAIAADGAARVVLRIPANKANERLKITLADDFGRNDRPADEVGTLISTLDGTSANPLEVEAVRTTQGPLAFATYRAPRDFSRSSARQYDDQAAFRFVSFQVESEDVQDFSSAPSLNIMRPPVVLVHGLWDSPSLWGNFLLGDQRFQIALANYNIPLNGQISLQGTVPFYPLWILNQKANANQLGFAYNAPAVLTQIGDAIRDFRSYNQAAAAQADVVAHSMGGVVTRWAETLPEFNDKYSFAIGNIHKLITVGTPHFGSPFAAQLLQDSCLQYELAKRGQIAFGASVVLGQGTPGSQIVSGAVYDLQGDADGTGGGLSPALNTLKNGSGHGVPAAQIAGQMTDEVNLASLTPLSSAFVEAVCLGASPLGSKLTRAGWPTIFNGNASDAIVSVTSQLASQTAAGGNVFPNVVHASSLSKLGLTGPAEIDPQSGILPAVINLLNAPSSGDSFHPLPQ